MKKETREKLQEIQNTSGIKSNSSIKLTKLLPHEPKISTYEEKLESVSRKLFTEDCYSVSNPTVLLPNISSSVATSTLQDTPLDALTDERDSTAVPENVVHCISQRPPEIENTLVTESNVDIKPKEQSYDKPKIIMIEKTSPKTNSKLLKRYGLLIPEFDASLSHIVDAPVSDFIHKSDEHAFPAKTLSDTAFAQDNISSVSGTIIQETNESLLTSLLTESNYQYSDLNFSFGEFHEPLSNSTDLHVPGEVARRREVSSDDESSDSQDSDPNYEPHEHDSSDAASDAEHNRDNTNHKLDDNNKSIKNISTASSGFHISVDSIFGSNGIDDDSMHVAKSRGRNGDKKLNFCIYCHKKQTKIARHLESKHKDEEDVKKFAVLPKNNMERRKIIDTIRKKRNFLFNTQSDYNDGELIVSRRPNEKFNRSARQFIACAHCKAFFAVSSLRVHFKKCTGKSSKTSRQVMLMSKKVVRRVHSRATLATRDLLFPPLREDEIVRIIRYDELVIIYANKMCQKYTDPRYYQMIRQRMRLMGRLLLTLRRLNKKITDLTSVYDPQFCDDVLEAINIEAKLGVVSTNNYKTPSVAFSMGTLLKQIGAILINECIKKHDDAKKKCVKDFLKLLAQEVTLSVNRTVEESQAQHNRRKKVELPSMEDIKKLHTYLSQKRNEAFQKLSNKFSEQEWMNLAETTLTSVQLFNRRRAGEIERTLIEDFSNYHTIDFNTDKDLFKSLSKQSQEKAKKYVRFTIRGKLNRTVPVLLDVRLLESIELILHHRRDMKIKEQNPYVFGVRGGGKPHKFLRACGLMRKFSVDCGATNPSRLRGTQLREHIATTCISLNLSENEVTDLANFMGHAEKIHRDIYRQPLVNREILQMSRLLEVARGTDDLEDDNDEDEDEDDYDGKPENSHDLGTNSNAGHDSDGTHDPDDPSGMWMESDKTKYTSSIKRKRSTSPYGPVRRVPWNDDEKKTVLRLFGPNLIHMKLPSLDEIQKAINKNPCLRNRRPPQVKTWLHNQMKKKKQVCFNNEV